MKNKGKLIYKISQKLIENHNYFATEDLIRLILEYAQAEKLQR